MKEQAYLKCRQSAERMKASLVGFITCNGLKGPSESHLFTPRKGQIHVIHILKLTHILQQQLQQIVNKFTQWKKMCNLIVVFITINSLNRFSLSFRKLTRYRRWRRTWRAHCASRMMMGPRVVVWAAVETLKKQQHRWRT